jgi:hypothetical protein
MRNYPLFLLFSIFFVALSNHSLNAQVLIGPKIGGSISWLTYDEFAKEDYKAKPFFGYSAGITTAFKVKKRFFLQLDFLYSRQGKRVEGKSDPILENFGVYHYINTPIIYRIDFKKAIWDTEFKWFLGAGPDVNFWWKGKGTLKSVELEEINIEQVNYDVRFENYPASPVQNALYVGEANRVQVGLLLASGLVFEPRPNQAILVEFRFKWGHSYLAKRSGIFSDVIAYEDNLRARNHGMQISVSYLIDIISDGKKEKKIYYQQ